MPYDRPVVDAGRGVSVPAPVGRGDVVSSLRAAVATADGAGVAISGPMGVGKTTVVRWLLTGLDAAGPVHWFQGTPGTSTIPFATASTALARHVHADGAPRAPGTSGASDADMAGRVAAALGTRGAVCVLDDLHWVDDRTVGVVHQLLSAPTRPTVIATIRDGERLSPAAVGLLREPVVVRHALAPLDAAATAELVATLLGGPPDPALLRTVVDLTRGNPLYVTELLATACADGTVTEEHGLWRARGPLAPSGILSDLVAARFDGLDPDALRAAELLAVAEGLDLDAAEAACGAEALDLLDRAGLLLETPGAHGTHLQLAHPVYAEVLKRGIGRLAGRSHRRALAAAVRSARTGAHGAPGLGPHDALRVARWLLAAGDQPEPDLALAAASEAHTTYDLLTAEVLARTAWEAEPTTAAGNLLAEVLHGQERFDEALAIVEQVAASAADDREKATLVALDAVARFHGASDVDGALAQVVRERAALTDPAARRALHVAEVYLLLMSERFDDLDAAIADLEAECPAHTTPAMRQLVAGAHIIRGRTAEALTLLDQPVLDPVDLFVRSEDLGAMADGLRALALTRAGRVLEAEAIGRATHPRCLDLGAPRARAAASYGLAMALLLQGRAAEAATWAADAVVAQQGILAPNGLLMAHALGLEAALDGDDPERATAERGALADLADTHERLYAALGWRAEASARVRLDGDAEGVAILLDRGARYQTTGSPDYANDLTFRAVVLGAEPSDAVEVLAATAHAAPPLGGLRHRVVAALVNGDVDDLEAAGEELRSLGCRVDAAFALHHAATVAARSGATRRATDLHHRAEALRRAGGGGTDGDRDDASDRPAAATSHPDDALDPNGALDAERWALLTDREEEVTRLAARGLPSKAIAETLHLSRRTVDHALQRAYAKLGVPGRTALVGRALPAPRPHRDA